MQVRFPEVAEKAKVANESLAEVRQQFVKSANAAGEALRQLTELSSRSSGLETEANYLKSELGKVAEARDDAICLAHEGGRLARML